MPGPHDLFARFTFGHPQRAMAELRAALPSFVVERVDWSTLRREQASVVDPRLKETQSDLLFSARLSGSARELLLYVLLEHQSSVDPWMALRMLRYVVRLLEQWREAHPGSELLPVVVPLVMYHGAEGGWTAPRRMEELFDVPEEEKELWQALVPRFEYLLDDLTAEREEALLAREGPPLARLAFLALRFGRTEELSWRVRSWAALFAQLQATPEGRDELVVFVRYLFLIGDKASRQAAERVLHSVMDTPRAEELMLTVGEELIQQGMERGMAQGLERGMAQGMAKGRADYVLRLLAMRGVQVDDSTRQRILACTDLSTLDQWFERALNATRLSDVLGE